MSQGSDNTAERDVKRFFYPHTRPPGALPEEQFLEKCTRCFECIKACPHDAIGFLTRSAGDAAGTPAMDPMVRPCYMCVDLPCVASCTPGALQPVDVSQIHFGTAVVYPQYCVPEDGVYCGKCVTACPRDAVVLEGGQGKPLVDDEICAGCGLCLTDCPAPAKPIDIKQSSFPMLTDFVK